MVMVILGILGVTLSTLLSTGVGAFMAGNKVADTLSKLRLSSERIARELRTVRRDPAATTDFDFLSRTPTSVQFRRFENNGVTVTTVTLDTSGTNLRLAYNTPPGTFTLSDQLGSLALTYWQQDGTAATSDANVAFVVIELSLTDSNGNSYPQRTRVALRNRQ
ncbi:MAG: hypothetical protein HZB57_09955 [Gammaproteobacteria bacterium]|nr:hypothetical protein [Gammaproteobacteria bacterium]